jgi:hypothetical protein
VLGAVTQAWDVQHRIRRRVALVTFAGVMVGLFGLFCVGAAIELVGPGLNAITRLI